MNLVRWLTRLKQTSAALICVVPSMACAQERAAGASLANDREKVPSACFARLTKSGVDVSMAREPKAVEPTNCHIEDAVHLRSMPNQHLPGARITFPDNPMVDCSLADKFVKFVGADVIPISRKAFGKDPISVNTGPGYECRPRNRQIGAKVSSHGSGLALDVTRISFSKTEHHALDAAKGPLETGFWSEFQTLACVQFNTVLGPAADAFHKNNIHVDLERRGKTGDVKYCR